MSVRELYQLKVSSAAELSGGVERLVASGRLPAATRLPTVRELAATLGLSPTTVAASYRSLAQRGVVRGDGRRGTFVAAGPPLPVATDRPLPAGVLDLRFGNPDGALMPSLRPHLRRLADVTKSYGEPATLPDLDAAACAQLRADGIPADRVVALSGALDGVERVLLAWLRPGDRVAVEDPGFPRVFDLLAALGLTAVPFAVDARGPVPESLRAALASGVDACVVTPRAQNPTGAALDAARARRLRTLLRAHPEVLVVEDDHAGPVAGAPAQTLVTAKRARWAVVRSVSKSLGPDLRVALVAGDATTLGRVEGRLRLGPGWVSHLLQRLVVDLWADAAVTAQLARATTIYRARRTALVDALGMHGIEVETPSGLNVWVPVPDEVSALRGLEDAGYAVAPGARFRLASPPAVRVTVAALPERRASHVARALATACAPARNRTAAS
ncbi:MAG TPA: aminotransferase class I/II-fold pyridoxal phosphate-dependent enzyme [Acidimicrobiia bacterium]|nr:aminotransferase class I/II-fold pyridoxal phosphate-dependent enzyme [Acidimicrobiia bacterium]